MEIVEIQGILAQPPESLDLVMLEEMRTQLKAAEEAAELVEGDPEAEGMAAQTIKALVDVVEALEQEQLRRLDALVQELQLDMDKAVTARKDVDARMIDDELQYMGKRRLQYSKYMPNDSVTDQTEDDDESAVHSTRHKTEMIAARLIDMMLPTNAVPFRVEADEDPDPECVPTFQKPQVAPPQEGQPPPPPPSATDSGSALDDANQRAAAKMFEKIKKQALEGGFLKHGRKAIRDACQRGVGITTGPHTAYKRKVKVKGDQADVSIDKTSVPGYEYVNPWYFWYDMTPTMEQSRKSWLLHLWDRSELMEFKKYPNVLSYPVDQLLELKDDDLKKQFPTNISAVLLSRNKALQLVEPIDTRYAIIKCFAALPAEKLERVTGIKWDHPDTMPLVEIWWCNGKCLKWKLSPLECGWRMPYYAFTPLPLDDTIYGWSVPYLMRSSQRFAEGALDATQINAAVSAAPLLFVRKGKVAPADGKWRLRGPKVMDVTGEEDRPIADSFGAFTIPSNVEQNLLLFKLAQDMIDQDTWFSQLASGNITSVQDAPASSVASLVNLNTVFQRMVAANADDQWFTPFCQQWGVWNLMYDEDPEIKGDFNYAGTASSALVAKDIQIQHTQVVAQMSDSPRWSYMTDDFSLFEAITSQLDIPNRDTVLLPREKAMEKLAQSQGSGPPPELQAKQMEIESRERIEMARLQNDAQKAQMSAEIDKMRMQTDLQVAQMNYQSVLVKASAESNTDMAILSEQARKATEQEATKRMQIGVKAQTELVKQRNELTATPNPHSRLD